jgi:hypothetical protein
MTFQPEHLVRLPGHVASFDITRRLHPGYKDLLESIELVAQWRHHLKPRGIAQKHPRFGIGEQMRQLPVAIENI